MDGIEVDNILFGSTTRNVRELFLEESEKVVAIDYSRATFGAWWNNLIDTICRLTLTTNQRSLGPFATERLDLCDDQVIQKSLSSDTSFKQFLETHSTENNEGHWTLTDSTGK